MKRIIVSAILAAQIFMIFSVSAATHTVVKGDSMWKIAVKYQVGISEIKNANPQIQNPNLIYPGQIINIPDKDMNVQELENEVVRLVNEIRVKNGLNKLTADWELSRVARYKSRDMSQTASIGHRCS